MTPRPFTVLDITEFYAETSGGIRTYLREKARYVSARPGLRQVMVLPGDRDLVTDGDGVRCYRLRGPRVPGQPPYRFLLATRSNRRIMSREAPDIIEVGSPGLVPWLVRYAARGLDAPRVYVHHSHFPRILAPFPERAGRLSRLTHAAAWGYARRIERAFDLTIACSAFAELELRQQGFERVARVPLGVDLDRFHPARRGQRHAVRQALAVGDRPVAAFVGRFAADKEVLLLAEAWPEVHRRTGAQLLCMGAGPQEEALRARVDGTAWGRVLPYERDRDRLAAFLAAIDLLVVPSSVETFGLAALEAMASATPVLAADRGGAGELVEASGAGARYEHGRAASLADAAALLLRRDLASLGTRGRAHAAAHHDWTTVFDRLFALYGALAAGGRRAVA